MKNYNIELLEKVVSFITKIPEKDRAKVYAHIVKLGQDISSVNVKIIKSPVREIKIGSVRILFIIKGSNIYLLSAFIKKSQKTPLEEIKKAYDIYSKLK